MPKIVYDEARNKKEEAAEKKQKTLIISVLSVVVLAIVGGLSYKAYYDNTHKPTPVAKQEVVEERHDLENVSNNTAETKESAEPKRELTPEESERVVFAMLDKDEMFSDEDELNDMLDAVSKACTVDGFSSAASGRMSAEQKCKVPAYTQVLNYIEATKIFMSHSDYNSEDISEHIGGIVKQAYSNEEVGEAMFNTCSLDDYTYTVNDYVYYAAPFLLECATSEMDPSPSNMLSEMSFMNRSEFDAIAHREADINTLPGAKAVEYVMAKLTDESWQNSLSPTVPINTNVYTYGDGTTSAYILPVQTNSGMIIGIFDSKDHLIDIREY